MFLATPYWYDLDPFRTESAAAAATIGVFWLVAAIPQGRRVTVFLAPALLLGLSFLPACSPFAGWVPHRSAHRIMLAQALAEALYLAFGFGFALWNFRLATRVHRLNGVVFTCALGAAAAVFVAVGATEWAQEIMAPPQRPTVWAVRIVWASPVVFVLVWFPVALYLNHRFRPPPPGFCPHCGYDLRGSIGRPSCPECGMPIPKPPQAHDVVA